MTQNATIVGWDYFGKAGVLVVTRATHQNLSGVFK